MASELIVQTLKGPTSGANANKVIIPSGQTLDASAATVVPSSGQILKYHQEVFTASVGTSSSTASEFLSFTYTPVVVSSHIYIEWHVAILVYNTSSQDARFKARTLVNGFEYYYYNKYGAYDYSGAPWHKDIYTFNAYANNTDGSTITNSLELGTNGAERVNINDSNTSYGRSIVTIYEVAK